MGDSTGAAAIGLMIGVTSGVIGIGGGAFLTPPGVLLPVRAQGTLIATPLLPIGLLTFWSHYKTNHMHVRLALLISAGPAVGGWVGGRCAQHLPEVILRSVFRRPAGCSEQTRVYSLRQSASR